jgi:tetratricopeptide (TPR) repeat protein
MNKNKQCHKILALFLFLSLVAVIPRQIFAQVEKGIELYNSSKYQEAEKVLREALKAAPRNAQANYYLGLSVLQQQKYGDALDIFLKVKDDQDKAEQMARSPIPNEYQIQMALARARLGLKQYSEAWKNLESAGIEEPSSSEVYEYRGVYYLNQEKNQEAIKELEKAISLDAQNAYAYYYVGLAYYRSGNGEKAVEALKIFLKLAPYAPEVAEAKSIIDKLC